MSDYVPTSRYSMLGAEAKIAALEVERDKLREENARLKTFIDQTADAIGRDGWIPVTERLPEEDGIVLTARTHHGIQKHYFDHGDDWFGKGFVSENGNSLTDVTHWRPLPKTPEVK